jgi:hypothetical protein
MRQTVNSMDDVRVGVINNGPFEPTWFYDSKGYTYTARTPTNKTAITVVPWVVAEHHWALGYRRDAEGNIKIVRKDWKEPNERDSRLESRMGDIVTKEWEEPKAGLAGHYIDDPKKKDWFLNRVQFKAKTVRQVMTEEEFNAG